MAVNTEDGGDATHRRQQPGSLGTQHLITFHEAGRCLDPDFTSGLEDGTDGNGAQDAGGAGGGRPQAVVGRDD